MDAKVRDCFLQRDEDPKEQENIKKTHSGHTRSCSWGFVTGSKTVKWRIITVLDYGVHWVRLLQLKQKLFHCLNGVIATQIYCNLLYLWKKVTVVKLWSKWISKGINECYTAVLKLSRMQVLFLDRHHTTTVWTYSSYINKTSHFDIKIISPADWPYDLLASKFLLTIHNELLVYITM